MSLEGVGREAHVDWSILARWERGDRRPPTDAVTRIDQILEASGFLIALHTCVLANTGNQTSPSQGKPHDADDMNHLRRQLLTSIAAVGAAVTLPPMDGLERLRSVVDQAVGGPSLEEWEETAWEYAHRIVSRPLPEVIPDLSVDLLALQKVMSSDAVHGGEWARVNARMTLLLAHALGSAGYSRESRLWWASARRAALHAGDDMMALVCAFEAVQGLYENRPIPLILSRADAALAATRGRPSVATAKALGARAHAYALLGDTRTAHADLDNQERVHNLLPEQ
jgi:hypothetical protein